MLMLSVALYIVLLAEKHPKWIAWAGLPLAYAYVIPPTNSISAVCLSVYVLVRHGKRIAGFLGLAAAVAVPFLVLNLTTYRRALTGGAARITTGDVVWQAFGSVTPVCPWYLPPRSLYDVSHSSSDSRNSICATPSLA